MKARTAPVLGQSRRLRAEEIVAVARERAGIELVDGFDRLVTGKGVTNYSAGRPIASSTHLVSGHIIRFDQTSELVWESAPVPANLGQRRVVFVFPMAMGNGSPLPQPGGTFTLYLDDRQLVRFILTKDTQTWGNGVARLHFDVRRIDATAFGQALALDELIRDESVMVDGMAYLDVAPELVEEGRPARLRVVAEGREPSTGWFRLGKPLFPFLTDNLEPGLSEVIAGAKPPMVGGRSLLLADLHAHSAESSLVDGCGVGSKDDLFRFARDVAGLDIFCLSEHDWQISPGDWEALGDLTQKFHEPGNFVTIPGFEWTSANHGHRNVYFRDLGAVPFPSFREGSPRNMVEDRAPTPHDLWEYLDRQAIPALTVPHHMSVAWFPVSLEHFHHPGYDRVAEIYSCWGDSLEHGQQVSAYADRVPELAFIEAIRAGHRVGFVASSDSHDGRPGAAQGTHTHPHLFHHLGSGRTAVLADGFDRHDVFDALRARRVYALTGPRITIDLSMDGHQMGSEVPASTLPNRPTLDVDVSTAVPIDRIEVFRDGHRCDMVMSGRRQERFQWVDPHPSPAAVSSYFIKVTRTDHEAAWTSPLWVVR